MTATTAAAATGQRRPIRPEPESVMAIDLGHGMQLEQLVYTPDQIDDVLASTRGGKLWWLEDGLLLVVRIRERQTRRRRGA